MKTLFERTRKWLTEHIEDKSAQLEQFAVIREQLPSDRDLHTPDVVLVTPDSKHLR